MIRYAIIALGLTAGAAQATAGMRGASLFDACGGPCLTLDAMSADVSAAQDAASPDPDTPEPDTPEAVALTDAPADSAVVPGDETVPQARSPLRFVSVLTHGGCTILPFANAFGAPGPMDGSDPSAGFCP